MKKLILILCLFFLPLTCYAEKFVIDAERNATTHNNLGLIHMRERCYAAAIKEFRIAIMINPETQATATYYANLAQVYLKIGYPALAQDCLERALKLNQMNLGYYEDLAIAYKQQKILPLKLKQYAKDTKNPLSAIMVGMILVQQGKETEGLSKLQEFCYLEPDLLITPGIKDYIERRIKGISNR